MLGPVKVFAINGNSIWIFARSSISIAMKGNSIWIFANGDTRKVPRCNVKVCRKKYDATDDDKVSEKDGKLGVKLKIILCVHMLFLPRIVLNYKTNLLQIKY